MGFLIHLEKILKKAINRLRNYGVDDIVLLTGDLRQQAETIASRMSIDRYESELLPEDKAKNILKFQSKGSNVIMIGDGVMMPLLYHMQMLELR